MAHAKLELLTTADMASHDAAPAARKGISSTQFQRSTRRLPTSADMASQIAFTAARVKTFCAQCLLGRGTVDNVSHDAAPADAELTCSRCTQVQTVCRLPLTQGIIISARLLRQSAMQVCMAAVCMCARYLKSRVQQLTPLPAGGRVCGHSKNLICIPLSWQRLLVKLPIKLVATQCTALQPRSYACCR